MRSKYGKKRETYNHWKKYKNRKTKKRYHPRRTCKYYLFNSITNNILEIFFYIMPYDKYYLIKSSVYGIMD